MARQPRARRADELEALARSIAIAALRFFMVKASTNRVIAFDFAEALAFEGESGPYLQYAARALAPTSSRKLAAAGIADSVTPEEAAALAEEAWSDDLWDLALFAAQLGDTVERAGRSLELSLLARHAYRAGAALQRRLPRARRSSGARRRSCAPPAWRRCRSSPRRSARSPAARHPAAGAHVADGARKQAPPCRAGCGDRTTAARRQADGHASAARRTREHAAAARRPARLTPAWRLASRRGRRAGAARLAALERPGAALLRRVLPPRPGARDAARPAHPDLPLDPLLDLPTTASSTRSRSSTSSSCRSPACGWRRPPSGRTLLGQLFVVGAFAWFAVDPRACRGPGGSCSPCRRSARSSWGGSRPAGRTSADRVRRADAGAARRRALEEPVALLRPLRAQPHRRLDRHSDGGRLGPQRACCCPTRPGHGRVPLAAGRRRRRRLARRPARPPRRARATSR